MDSYLRRNDKYKLNIIRKKMALRVPGEIELEYRKAETGKSKTGQAMPPSSLQTYTVPHLGLC